MRRQNFWTGIKETALDIARSEPRLRTNVLWATKWFWLPLRALITAASQMIPDFSAADISATGNKKILVVSAIKDGGLAKISTDIFSGLTKDLDIYFASISSSKIIVKKDANIIYSARGNFKLNKSQNSELFDRKMESILGLINPEIVHLEHLSKVSHNSVQVIKKRGIFISHSIHDYFDICPSHNLLDDRGSFCGGTCTQGKGWCDISLINPGEIAKIKNEYVFDWRALNTSVLENVDLFFCPSLYTANLFTRFYPSTLDRTKVIPHAIAPDLKLASTKQPQGAGKVLFLGNYLPAKGSRKLRQIAKLGAQRNIVFYHAGKAPIGLAKWVNLLGPYKRQELASIISEVKPDCVIFASIWAETYALVVDEAAACGVPVISLVPGEVSERVIREALGLVLDPHTSPEKVLNEIDMYLRDQDAQAQVALKLEAFRSKISSRHSKMINEYKVVFENATIRQ